MAGSVHIIMRTVLLLLTLMFPSAAAQAAELDTATVLATINARRAAEGLAPLRLNEALTLAAQDRMSEMIDLAYWGHVSPDGTQPFVWLPARGYQYSRAGENLASGFDTPEVLVEAWLESPGHRATLMSPRYQDIGLAIIEGSTTGRSAGHSVVALFASARLPQ